ncbi:hypothetical protein IT396_02100 [Candidatus Nomurabacteria bacterium]|nr:hypothetical protein [Candidatus Nomurabacteria bacterium]
MSALTRRSLLCGASTLALTLFLPPLGVRPQLDREALEFFAHRIRQYLLARPRDGQILFDYVYGNLMRDSSHKLNVTLEDWLREDKVVHATHLTLQAAFNVLAIASNDGEYKFPLWQDSRLNCYGQLVLTYLPLAPSDYKPELFPMLDRLAPHYLA